jgi:hypothetical protein
VHKKEAVTGQGGYGSGRRIHVCTSNKPGNTVGKRCHNNYCLQAVTHIAAFSARQDITAKNYGGPGKEPPSNGGGGICIVRLKSILTTAYVMYISSHGRMYPVILIDIRIPHDKIISSDGDHAAMVMHLTGDTTT